MAVMEGIAPDHAEKAQAAGLRQKLGSVAAKFFKEAVLGRREYTDPRAVLLERPIQDENRMNIIHREAQRSNMINLQRVEKGEFVMVTLLRHGNDGHLYGHARNLVLQHYDDISGAPVFKVMGDDEKIYEKTDPSIAPFRDFDAIRVSASRPNVLTGEDDFTPFLDYGEQFSFQYLAGNVQTSDYKVAQVSVAHDGQLYDLLHAPAREQTIFRG